jgi:hypothetical protein
MATATVESPKENPVHYPPDRCFRVWVGPAFLLLFVALAVLPLVAAWAQFLTVGLPPVPTIASTGAVMVLLNVWHPPAGATTLIIALGIITRPYHLLIVEAAVAILVLQALIINRLAGIEYPVWARAVPVGQREPIAAEGRPEDENLHRTKRCT